MKIQNVIMPVLFALAGFAAHAQSADRLTDIIGTSSVNAGQVAYLAAVYTGAVGDDADYGEALRAMQQQKLMPAKYGAGDVLTLGKIAGIFARTTGIGGGILYTISKSDRYAFRELKARGILPDTADPGMKVSGRDVIAVLDGCIGE